MRTPITVAFGERDAQVVQMVREIVFEDLSRNSLTFNIDLTPALTAEEQLRGLPAMVREACIRAHLIRADKKALVGIASASGVMELVYNSGARRVTFQTSVIAGVDKGGPITITAPSACPDEAYEAYLKEIQRNVAHLRDEKTGATEADYATDLVVQAWTNVPRAFADPTIEFLI